ncbi:MAG: hypothetical protein Q7W51_09545 [Coriobacteriia bacterium]|nr:hypothetical protein [Coriobacteriia bacterium]
MRKIVAALLVAALALTLVGCGGEEAPAEEEATETDAATPAADPEEEVVADKSANDSDLAPMAFPSFTTTDTPAVFTDKLAAGRPMMIVFYDDGQQVTATVLAEIDAVMGEYRGLIDLVTFSVGADNNNPATLGAVTYASELGVASTPYIIIVDGGGYITWRSRGYAEQKIVRREVERATR